MNRAFKYQFHNGESDEKPIVTVSLIVNNGKRFKALDGKGKKALLSTIESFQRSLDGFKTEISGSKITTTKK